MKHSLSLKLVLCIAAMLMVSSVCAAQVYSPQPFTADMIVAKQNGNKTNAKLSFSPPNMRMDMSEKGQDVSVITDGNAQKSYVLMHAMKMYMEMQANQSNPMTARAPQAPSFDSGKPCGADWTCQKAGVETVNGRVCDKWSGTDKQGGTVTVWVDQKLNFPIKKVGSDGSTFELTNIKEGKPDAALFQPPAGYSKMDPSMMRRAPGQ